MTYYLTHDIYDAAEKLGWPMNGFVRMEAFVLPRTPLSDTAKMIDASLHNVVRNYLRGLR